ALLVSIIIRIQHWPGGVFFVFAGVAILLLSYTLHFINKRNKVLKDILTLGWLLSICVIAILSLYHFSYTAYVGMAGNCILAVAVAIHIKGLWSVKAPNSRPESALF